MKQILILANTDFLLRLVVKSTNEKPESTLPNHFDGFEPFTSFDVPSGKCDVYKFNETFILISPYITIEINGKNIQAEYNFDFNDNIDSDEFANAAHVLICYIFGYLIDRSPASYRELILKYILRKTFNEYNTSVDFSTLFSVIAFEEKLGITDHIAAPDILFEQGLTSYIRKSPGIELTAIDITGVESIFKANDIRYM